MKWPSHGGQPEAVKRQFNLSKADKLLDFSANINPFGPPDWLKQALNDNFQAITCYPDPSYSKAKQRIADSQKLASEQVLVTNGGAEAIFLVAKYFQGKNAMIIHPTFSEYERACLHYQLQVQDIYLNIDEQFDLPLDNMKQQFLHTDVVFLCRPNNPTGTVIAEKDVRYLLETGVETGTTLVVDEAFIDFLPESIADLSSLLSEFTNLILLRSLTKIYAIPGLRLGYLLAHHQIVETIKRWQIPWSVNALADSIIPQLLEDNRFVKDSRQLLTEQFKRIRKQLIVMDFYVSPSNVNFYLLRDRQKPNQTEDLFKYLLSEGILARHTNNFKGLHGNFLRLAVRSQAENQQLLEKLQQWREQS